MKNFLKIFFLFLMTIIYGQGISSYSIILVPKKFIKIDQNKYGLNDLLATKLKTKRYAVVQDMSQLENPCEAITADIVNTSNWMTNKVRIEFRDCHNAVIATFDGKSSTKDIEPGMKEALGDAVKQVAFANPSQKINSNENTKSIGNTSPIETNNDLHNKNKALIFSNGTLNLNKINISDSQFILAGSNNSVPYAIFKTTSKKDVFRVQLENGTQTLGYFEDGKMVIELPNSDGSFRKEVFIEK